MVGLHLGNARGLQNLRPGNSRLGRNRVHCEHTFGKSSRFVEHHGVYIFKAVQHKPALHQNAPARGAPNPPEIAERYGDDQSARAGNHQQHKGTVNPFPPLGPAQKRRKAGHQHGQKHHYRRIHSGETGNKTFGRRFAQRGLRLACVTNKPQRAAAAILAGIHHGIKNQIDPGEAIDGNGYEQARETLPTDWLTALRTLEQSAWAKETLGEDFLKIFLAIKWEEFRQFVSEVGEQDWRWYLVHA